MTNITEQFKAKLAEAGQQTEFKGFPLRLRYVPIEVWIEAGRVPHFMAVSYLSGLSGDVTGAAAAAEQMTEDEALDYVRFKRRVIEFAAIEPRISFDEQPADGAISAAEIAGAVPGLLEYIFAFATFQSADAKIQTAESEVSAQALTNFHGDGAGPQKSAGFVVHGAGVQPAPVNAVANH